nr:MAG TPA: Pre-mRNA branch site protein p14 mutant, pre-mRNA splicing, adenine [Caudoviricetes sp.]
MHQAVDLLLKRMDSNPDEFMSSHPRQVRWDKIIRSYDSYLTDEERDAIRQKYSEIQMGAMHKDIMAELLYGEERAEVASQSAYAMTSAGQEKMWLSGNGTAGIGGVFPSNTLNIASSSINPGRVQLGNQTLDEDTLAKQRSVLGAMGLAFQDTGGTGFGGTVVPQGTTTREA